MIDSRLLQLCDSAFPSGAFSHSFGLETAITERRLHSASAVHDWIERYIGGTLATLDARALVLAMHGGTSIAEIDAHLSASIFAFDTRAATRRLARATLEAFVTMGLVSDGILTYRTAIANGESNGHHALAYALGYTAISADARDAACAYISSAAAALAAVAARTIPLGQRDIGSMLWSLRATIERAAECARIARSLDDLSTGAIACEIDAMRHSALDARLFAS